MLILNSKFYILNLQLVSLLQEAKANTNAYGKLVFGCGGREAHLL